jgi:hypothetical protein
MMMMVVVVIIVMVMLRVMTMIRVKQHVNIQTGTLARKMQHTIKHTTHVPA